MRGRCCDAAGQGGPHRIVRFNGHLQDLTKAIATIKSVDWTHDPLLAKMRTILKQEVV
jgi:hypothetical protein